MITTWGMWLTTSSVITESELINTKPSVSSFFMEVWGGKGWSDHIWNTVCNPLPGL